MKILITGANGFIGKNLALRLKEDQKYKFFSFNRGQTYSELEQIINEVDAIIHLAGENRPTNPKDFSITNVGLTKEICSILQKNKKCIPIIFTSSIQAEINNPYGRSKFSAEQHLMELSKKNLNPIAIYRLPGVFGKWSRPNYNSVVATFCHNIANDLPINVDNPNYILRLVYIDDVIDSFIELLKNSPRSGATFHSLQYEYEITLSELAQQIRDFAYFRKNLVSGHVGTGFLRALYATYISYLPIKKAAYAIPCHSDMRGVFVEMLKTKDSGQFSFFTAHPGVTRGGHYHHTKTEKFLVLKGNARFRFRHILTDEFFSLDTSGSTPVIVQTIPGWSHDITNNGDDELIVMLWANEIFDNDKPDTIASVVEYEKA